MCFLLRRKRDYFLSENKRLELVRDIFVLRCFTGMRKIIRNRIKEGAIPETKNEGERSYKIPALQYYETRTVVKYKNTYRNIS